MGELDNDTVFTWAAPPLKFGIGALDEVGAEVAAVRAQRVLVLTDAGLAETGVPDRVRERIEQAGIHCEVFDGVAVEPTDVSVEHAVRWARGTEWDAFVAVGGGSTIDTAKAVNLLTTHDGELLDYVTPPIGGGQVPSNPVKPLIAIPTTAGTGSESTTICVVDLLSQHLKAAVSHARLRPMLALVDPMATMSMPPAVTAASGMDVLCHALESYTSIRFDTKPKPADTTRRPAFCGANPISDIWSEKALELVGAHLRTAVHNGRDRQAREGMALAATCAGTGFGNAGTHVPHANAYPIAGMVGEYQSPDYPKMPMVPHGQAVAATAPAVFSWTYPANPARHLRAAELLSGQTFIRDDGPEALPEVLRELMVDVNMPAGLGSFGYTAEDVESLVDGALKQTRQLAVVPRRLDRAAATEIFRRSL